MWTRAELKSRAKSNLRKYYWAALAVSMISALFSSNSGGSSIGGGANAGMNASQGDISFSGDFGSGIGSVVDEIPKIAGEIAGSMDSVAVSIMLISILIGALIALAVGIFVSPIIEIGKNRFYMESRSCGYSAGMDCLIWGFRNHYLNIIWIMFLRGLLVFLGTLFCVIPGIYLAYCYCMVPYILAENPDIKASDALRMSKDMVNGHKFKTWVLEISFLGWWILGAMACGIGTFLVFPYYDATFAELYAVLRTPFSNYLNGFSNAQTDAGYDNGYYGAYQGGQEPNGYQSYPYEEQNQGWNQAYGQQPGYEQPYEQQPGYEQPYEQQPGYEQAYEQQPYEQPYVQPQKEAYQQIGQQSYELKRSEGGPGRGYYLNGVFYPYTEDELNELEKNQKK